MLALIILSFLALPLSNGSAFATGQEFVTSISTSSTSKAIFDKKMQQALKKAEAVLLNEMPFPSGAAVGFAKNSSPLPQGFREKLADAIMDNEGRFDNISEHVSMGLSYMAAGGDLNRIGDVDLHAFLMNHTGLEKAEVEALAEAYLISWVYHPVKINRTGWYPDIIYFRLLERQLKDGGWPGNGMEHGDVRTTAKVLTAIGSVGESQTQTALDWLRNKLEEQAGSDFTTTSISEVVIALSTLGMDAAAFLETGDQPLNLLLSRQLPGGAFTEDGGSSPSIEATQQAYLALTAYRLFAEDGSKLYADLNHPLALGKSRIHIEGPEGTIAEGQLEIKREQNVTQAVEIFLQKAGIDYELRQGEKGALFTSIEDIPNGRYGGSDGWKMAIRNYGSWSFLKDDNFRAANVENVLLYYSDKTALVDQVLVQWKYEDGQIMNGPPQAGTPFTLTLKKATQQFGNLPVSSGVQVSLAGKTVVTDKNGSVSFPGMKPGVYELTVSAYRKSEPPTLAKRTIFFSVSSPELASFIDAKKVANWATTDIGTALSQGWMQGVSGNRLILAPKKTMTRAEFVVMLLRVLQEPSNSLSPGIFADVPAGRWYSGAISRAVNLGIIDGESRHFKPDRAITREEAAVMMANALGLPTLGSEAHVPFKDIAALSDTSRQAIQIVYEQNVMKGDPGFFHPGKTLVREEAAAVLNRMRELLSFQEL